MKKVITYGTFDLFHQGHYNILKRAKQLGDYLIVGVTGESYDMERGKLSVKDSLVTRIENVKKTGFADKIIIEEYLGQKIHDVIEYDIDVLVVGSDWKGKFDHLRKYCEVVYLERTKDISSTQLREQNGSICRMGIATDSVSDNNAVEESKYVSGIHAESVYSDNRQIAKEFCEKFELDKYEDDFEAFLEGIEIVYVKTERKKRYPLIKKALLAGKHVISDPAITLDSEELKELFQIAKENKVILLENMPTLYLQAFNQLLWNARGNLIGDLVSVKCGVNKNALIAEDTADLYDCISLPVCVLTKMLGMQYDINIKVIKDTEGRDIYALLMNEGKTLNTSFVFEVGMGVSVNTGMVILGTEGSIEVPGDWWKTGYFKMKSTVDNNFKRYSSNFEGNGFRYIIQSLLSMIEDERIWTSRVLPEEQIKVTDVLKHVEMLNKG